MDLYPAWQHPPLCVTAEKGWEENRWERHWPLGLQFAPGDTDTISKKHKQVLMVWGGKNTGFHHDAFQRVTQVLGEPNALC